MNNIPVIAIDGPGGVGKSSSSQYLAQQLGWHFLDSGALYRILAFQALSEGVDSADARRLVALAKDMKVEFVFKKQGVAPDVVVEGKSVLSNIRTPAVAHMASLVSVHAEVRAALMTCQRAFRKPPGLVADGRDMGTVVFPDAPVKFFLTASPEVRALRRYNQLKEKGIGANLQEIQREIVARDARDAGRVVAPMRPADDAVCLDTSDLSLTQVLEVMRRKIEITLKTGT